MTESESSFKDKLKAIYSKQDKIAPLIEGLEDEIPVQTMKDYYVRLQIVLQEDHEDNQAYEKISGEKEEIEVEKLFNSDRHSAHKLLIMGGAGVGKSTLMQYLAFRWGESDLWEEKFEYVYRVSLKQLLNKSWKEAYEHKDLNSSMLKCLVHFHLVSGMTRKERSELPISDLKWIDNTDKHKILLLLDGFDEVAHLKDERSLSEMFEEIFEHTYIIMTSRPNAVNKHLKEKFDQKIENMGLDYQGVQQYFENYFKNDKKKGQELGNFLRGNTSIRDICHIPVNIAMLCYIWANSDSNQTLYEITNVSDLYFQVVDQLGFRYYAKNLPKVNKTELASIWKGGSIVLDELTTLEYTAYKAMTGGGLNIREEDRQETLIIRGMMARNDKEGISIQSSINFLKSQGIIQEMSIYKVYKYGILRTEGFHVKGDSDADGASNDKENRKEVSETDLQAQNYSFIHLTFQEYLTARYLKDRLASGSKEEQNQVAEFIAQHRNQPRYLMLLRFMAGSLTAEKSKSTEVAVKLFWDAVICNVDGVLELGVNNKVFLLMSLLAQANIEDKLDDRIPNKEVLVDFIDCVVLNDIPAWTDAIKDSNYISQNIRDAVYQAVVNENLAWAQRKLEEIYKKTTSELRTAIESLGSFKKMKASTSQVNHPNQHTSQPSSSVIDKVNENKRLKLLNIMLSKYNKEEQKKILQKFSQIFVAPEEEDRQRDHQYEELIKKIKLQEVVTSSQIQEIFDNLAALAIQRDNEPWRLRTLMEALELDERSVFKLLLTRKVKAKINTNRYDRATATIKKTVALINDKNLTTTEWEEVLCELANQNIFVRNENFLTLLKIMDVTVNKKLIIVYLKILLPFFTKYGAGEMKEDISALMNEIHQATKDKERILASFEKMKPFLMSKEDSVKADISSLIIEMLQAVEDEEFMDSYIRDMSLVFQSETGSISNAATEATSELILKLTKAEDILLSIARLTVMLENTSTDIRKKGSAFVLEHMKEINDKQVNLECLRSVKELFVLNASDTDVKEDICRLMLEIHQKNLPDPLPSEDLDESITEFRSNNVLVELYWIIIKKPYKEKNDPLFLERLFPLLASYGSKIPDFVYKKLQDYLDIKGSQEEGYKRSEEEAPEVLEKLFSFLTTLDDKDSIFRLILNFPDYKNFNKNLVRLMQFVKEYGFHFDVETHIRFWKRRFSWLYDKEEEEALYLYLETFTSYFLSKIETSDYDVLIKALSALPHRYYSNRTEPVLKQIASKLLKLLTPVHLAQRKSEFRLDNLKDAFSRSCRYYGVAYLEELVSSIKKHCSENIITIELIQKLVKGDEPLGNKYFQKLLELFGNELEEELYDPVFAHLVHWIIEMKDEQLKAQYFNKLLPHLEKGHEQASLENQDMIVAVSEVEDQQLMTAYLEKLLQMNKGKLYELMKSFSFPELLAESESQLLVSAYLDQFLAETKSKLHESDFSDFLEKLMESKLGYPFKESLIRLMPDYPKLDANRIISKMDDDLFSSWRWGYEKETLEIYICSTIKWFLEDYDYETVDKLDSLRREFAEDPTGPEYPNQLKSFLNHKSREMRELASSGLAEVIQALKDKKLEAYYDNHFMRSLESQDELIRLEAANSLLQFYRTVDNNETLIGFLNKFSSYLSDESQRVRLKIVYGILELVDKVNDKGRVSLYFNKLTSLLNHNSELARDSAVTIIAEKAALFNKATDISSYLSKFERFLSDRDQRVRISIVKGMTKLLLQAKDKSLITEHLKNLAQLLTDKEAAVRNSSVSGMFEVLKLAKNDSLTSRYLAGILDLLTDEDREVQDKTMVEALRLLKLHNNKSLIAVYLKRITAVFDDGYYPMRVMALESFVELFEASSDEQVGSECFDKLIPLFADDILEVRDTAMKSVIQVLKLVNSKKLCSEILNKLIALITHGKGHLMYYSAVLIPELFKIAQDKALISEVSNKLTPMLDNNDQELRNAIVDILKEVAKLTDAMPTKTAYLDRLLRLLGDNNQDIRTRAVNGVSEIITKARSQQLIVLYLEKLTPMLTSRDDKERISGIKLMVQLLKGTDSEKVITRFLDILVQMFDEKNKDVKYSVLNEALELLRINRFTAIRVKYVDNILNALVNEENKEVMSKMLDVTLKILGAAKDKALAMKYLDRIYKFSLNQEVEMKSRILLWILCVLEIVNDKNLTREYLNKLCSSFDDKQYHHNRIAFKQLTVLLEALGDDDVVCKFIDNVLSLASSKKKKERYNVLSLASSKKKKERYATSNSTNDEKDVHVENFCYLLKASKSKDVLLKYAKDTTKTFKEHYYSASIYPVIDCLTSIDDLKFITKYIEEVLMDIAGHIIDNFVFSSNPLAIQICQYYVNHTNRTLADPLIGYLTDRFSGYLSGIQASRKLLKLSAEKDIANFLKKNWIGHIFPNRLQNRFNSLYREPLLVLNLVKSNITDLDQLEGKKDYELIEWALTIIGHEDINLQDSKRRALTEKCRSMVIYQIEKLDEHNTLNWTINNFDRLLELSSETRNLVFKTVFHRILSDQKITKAEEELMVKFVNRGLTTSLTRDGRIIFEDKTYKLKGNNIESMFNKLAKSIFSQQEDALSPQYRDYAPIFTKTIKNGMKKAASDVSSAESIIAKGSILTNESWLLTFLNSRESKEEIYILEQRDTFGDRLVFWSGGKFMRLHPEDSFDFELMLGSLQGTGEISGKVYVGRSKVITQDEGNKLLPINKVDFDAIKPEASPEVIYFQEELLKQGNTDRIQYLNEEVKLLVKDNIKVLEKDLSQLQLTPEDKEKFIGYYKAFILTFSSVYHSSQAVDSGSVTIDTNDLKVTILSTIASFAPFGIGETLSGGINGVNDFLRGNSMKNDAKLIKKLAVDAVELSTLAGEIGRRLLKDQAMRDRIINAKDSDPTGFISKLQVFYDRALKTIAKKTRLPLQEDKLHQTPAFSLGESDANVIIEDWVKRNKAVKASNSKASLEIDLDEFTEVVLKLAREHQANKINITQQTQHAASIFIPTNQQIGQQSLQPVNVMASFKSKQGTASNCCQMFAVPFIKYDNPLLNQASLLQEFSARHGSKSVSKLIDLSHKLDFELLNEICKTEKACDILMCMLKMNSDTQEESIIIEFLQHYKS